MTASYRMAELAVHAAHAQGADEAEAFIEEVAATQIRVFNGEVEALRILRTTGIGLRVLVAGRRGYGFDASANPQQLARLAEWAVRAARLSQPDPHNGLPAPVAARSLRGYTQEKLAEIPLERKVAAALKAEQAARKSHPAITGTEDVEYFDFDRVVTLVTTTGMRAHDEQSLSILTATAVARGLNGDHQSGTACVYDRLHASLDPEAAGQEAARRAVRVMDAEPIPTCEVPVILDPWVSLRLVDLLAQSVSADAVRKGRSSLKDRIGESITSGLITVVDDGCCQGSSFAASFDTEGIPMQRKTVIAAGRLEGYLYDAYEARAAGRASTGNATRWTFRDAPVLSKSNLYIEPGNQSPAAMIRSTQRGLYVQEVQGFHLANPVSGDFSVGVTGGWIENGEWVRGVRGITIAGNLFDLLRRIDAVGNDLRFSCAPMVILAAAGAPTLRVSSLVVSGT